MLDLNPQAVLWTGFDQAIVGCVERCGSLPVFLYDYQKCIELLEFNGMSNIEAQNYIEFNVLGAYVGDHTPMFTNAYGEFELFTLPTKIKEYNLDYVRTYPN